MASVTHENDERECVSQYKLADSCKDQEQPAIPESEENSVSQSSAQPLYMKADRFSLPDTSGRRCHSEAA